MQLIVLHCERRKSEPAHRNCERRKSKPAIMELREEGWKMLRLGNAGPLTRSAPSFIMLSLGSNKLHVNVSFFFLPIKTRLILSEYSKDKFWTKYQKQPL